MRNAVRNLLTLEEHSVKEIEASSPVISSFQYHSTSIVPYLPITQSFI
jgi:hypothetical protein